MRVYKKLLAAYGPQGWWPLLSVKGSNPTKTGSVNGYHPGDYSYPRTDAQRFEICLGAILTQNTAWPNVEKALLNLKALKALDPKKLLALSDEKLKEAIRPAGYFNQKAKKLKIFTEFYIRSRGKTPAREELLSIWGVGPETADSILLYAYRQPVFVVDTYTRRIFGRLGLVGKEAKYEEIQSFFQKNLAKNPELFNEYHALLVEHAKRHCKTRPECEKCLFSPCKNI